jgi:hypothetical protein
MPPRYSFNTRPFLRPKAMIFVMSSAVFGCAVWANIGSRAALDDNKIIVECGVTPDEDVVGSIGAIEISGWVQIPFEEYSAFEQYYCDFGSVLTVRYVAKPGWVFDYLGFSYTFFSVNGYEEWCKIGHNDWICVYNSADDSRVISVTDSGREIIISVSLPPDPGFETDGPQPGAYISAWANKSITVTAELQIVN